MQGYIGHVTISDDRKTITKRYYEETRKLNRPELTVYGNTIYRIENISEHEAHTILLKTFPDDYPKIYSYRDNIPAEERDEPTKYFTDRHVDVNDYNFCEVTMEFIDKPLLGDVFYKYDPVKVLVMFFKRLISVIKEAHVIPADFHFNNILSDFPRKLYMIDYCFYQRIEPVCVAENGVTYTVDTPYTLTTISDSDAEHILMNYLRLMHTCHKIPYTYWNMLSMLYGQRSHEILAEAFTECGFSDYFKNEVKQSLLNPTVYLNRAGIIRSYIGGAERSCAPIRPVLKMMRDDPQRFAELQLKYETIKVTPEIIHDSTIDVNERAYAWCKFLKYNLSVDWNIVYGYVMQNLEELPFDLYVDEVPRSGLVSGTKNKIGHIRVKHPRAAHLKRVGQSCTAIYKHYNRLNPSDNDFLKWNAVKEITINDEYILDPTATYVLEDETTLVCSS